MAIRRWPGAGKVIGWMPARSRYYRQRIEAWVVRTAHGGRYGRVPVPYAAAHRFGWIDLRGLRRKFTDVVVNARLSMHRLVVKRDGHVVVRVVAATGAPSTPTPTGEYFVTDRVAFTAGSEYGTFAFGISGIQPHLPAGWTGGENKSHPSIEQRKMAPPRQKSDRAATNRGAPSGARGASRSLGRGPG